MMVHVLRYKRYTYDQKLCVYVVTLTSCGFMHDSVCRTAWQATYLCSAFT